MVVEEDRYDPVPDSMVCLAGMYVDGEDGMYDRKDEQVQLVPEEASNSKVKAKSSHSGASFWKLILWGRQVWLQSVSIISDRVRTGAILTLMWFILSSGVRSVPPAFSSSR